MLLTGAHHARELTTISQTVLQMLEILYKYEKGDAQTLKLVSESVLIFIPILNIDGVTQIDSFYSKTSRFL